MLRGTGKYALNPRVVAKMKPKNGFSYFLHLGLTAILPALIFVLIRVNFVQLAIALLLLSKWRMFAVKPRYWSANIRANAVDLIFGLSIITYMSHTTSISWQLIWALLYAVWLLGIKPGTRLLFVSLQALLAQIAGLMAVYIVWSAAPLMVFVAVTWVICYASARHFFATFDEPHAPLYAHSWGYFAAALTWVLGHWLLFYSVIAQPTLLLGVISFSLACLYYLDQTDRLSLLMRRQIVFIMCGLVLAILLFSDWGDKAV